MKWDKFTITTTTEAEDLISCMLADLGIEGVEIEDNVQLSAADTAKMFIDFLPELAPDDGVGKVSFYLDADEDHSEILAQVKAELAAMRAYADIGAGTIEESQTEDKDWMNNWKEFFHAFTIGNILIKPTGEELSAEDKGKILIEIDPGVSFGTGKHETTRLCISQLQKYLKSGDRVLDLGCGSGILSIVSLKLGAAHVTGTDIDEMCLTSTRENMKVNHLPAESGTFYCGNLIDDEALQEVIGTEAYELVAANILADVIIPMAPVIPARMKRGGVLITSGIINFKEGEVCAALEAAGLTILEILHDGEWVSITARKV